MPKNILYSDSGYYITGYSTMDGYPDIVEYDDTVPFSMVEISKG